MLSSPLCVLMTFSFSSSSYPGLYPLLFHGFLIFAGRPARPPRPPAELPHLQHRRQPHRRQVPQYTTFCHQFLCPEPQSYLWHYWCLSIFIWYESQRFHCLQCSQQYTATLLSCSVLSFSSSSMFYSKPSKSGTSRWNSEHLFSWAYFLHFSIFPFCDLNCISRP